MKIKKLDHFLRFINEYDAFIIDLWGVMHNGIKLEHSSAIEALSEFDENQKKLFFYQTHQDPKKVKKFLKKMKMDNKFLKMF